jgi:excisionase family DNA binding protein
MSIGAINKLDFPSNQHANRARSDIPAIDAIDRPPPKFGVRSATDGINFPAGTASQQDENDERLLNARQVADKLGVSERFIRDHTTRRSPKIPAVKLGKLIRYRRADVDVFMAELRTLPASNRSRFGV